MLQDDDADMLEGVLQSLDLSNGLALVISSPGGDGIAAERIVNMCRSYSGTGEFWAIVPGKAKSAATIVCFGASKITMGPTSELGPVDPQLNEGPNVFSVYNLVASYEDRLKRAVENSSGNMQPYLQQLEHSPRARDRRAAGRHRAIEGYRRPSTRLRHDEQQVRESDHQQNQDVLDARANEGPRAAYISRRGGEVRIEYRER